MKTFDIKSFEKNKNHLNEYLFIDTDSTIIEQRKQQLGYYEIIKHKESFFQTRNDYYENGNLKSTVQDFPNDFLFGIQKEYDEQGKLIKETNHDAPFKFDWENILTLIEARKIDMNAYGFEVTRGSSEKGTAWSITYNKNEEEMLLGIILINGITGEIIKEFDVPYPSED